jgi:hypothetical protein
LTGLASLALEDAVPPALPALDSAALRTELDNLKTLLVESNSTSLELAERLTRHAGGTSLEASLRSIAEAIDEFDFDQALHTLQGLESTLD